MTATSIRELRDSTGMTQKEFAGLFHIPLSTLRKWEQGSASPPEYVLELIARSLPAADQNLEIIAQRKQGSEKIYFDRAANTLVDRFGNRIHVHADLSRVKAQNLRLYTRELFQSYYEIVERFERDCRYDEEEDILWTSEEFPDD